MKGFTCEIGDKFGYWEVIDNTNVSKSGHNYVKVRCKCGKEEYKCLSDLRNGKATGCRSCKARERSIKINIGDVYKNWTVIDGPKSSKHYNIEWYCQCKCGKTRWFTGNELVDPKRCFSCSSCAGKDRTLAFTLKNGRVGELTTSRYSKLKKSAKVRNIVFKVTKEYLWNLFLQQNRKCAITGDKIDHLKEASLDRKDSLLGYIEGNVQWVTKQANLSKHIMTMEELYVFCRKVLNHANQQPSQPLTKLEGSETNS